jgi:hypothetical protein
MAFFQYKAGAIPGKPLKRKITPEETRKRKEKDRERKFIDSWEQDRPWLHHNIEQNVMVCNWCIEANGPKRAVYLTKKSLFIVGPVIPQFTGPNVL